MNESNGDGNDLDMKKELWGLLGVTIPLLLVAVTMYGLYTRKKTKPIWWLKLLRNDHRDIASRQNWI